MVFHGSALTRCFTKELWGSRDWWSQLLQASNIFTHKSIFILIPHLADHNCCRHHQTQNIHLIIFLPICLTGTLTTSQGGCGVTQLIQTSDLSLASTSADQMYGQFRDDICLRINHCKQMSPLNASTSTEPCYSRTIIVFVLAINTVDDNHLVFWPQLINFCFTLSYWLLIIHIAIIIVFEFVMFTKLKTYFLISTLYKCN